jgi:phenylacetate-CoA ligase
MSIDYYGANVSPDSVREILCGIDGLGEHMEGFRLIAMEDEQHNKTMEVAIELCDGIDPAAFNREQLSTAIFDRLSQANGDFANAYRKTATPDQLPRLSMHRKGAGPFTGGDGIKKSYIDTADVYDKL